MEIPSNIKNLYRHWHLHTGIASKSLIAKDIMRDGGLFKEIKQFIDERISVWKKKVNGETAPFTHDPVLSKYRFCNIFREFDKQTIEFHELLNPLRDNFSLWLLNMFYCRLVAKPETVKSVGLLSFDKGENKLLLQRLLETKRPRYGTPYVFPVSTIIRSKTPTRELFIAEYLPSIMDSIVKEISGWDKKSVFDGVEEILPKFGFNLNFLWTEVLIDVAYQFPEYIDLFKRFPTGPGSIPTMKRINPDADPSVLVCQLSDLNLVTGITYNGKELRLSAENWEGIGCEFRKYTNLKQGNGRKRIYQR